jgi:hypothetical protein
MNRMTKLFQQKSNRKFDEYLLAKKKSLSSPGIPGAPGVTSAYPTLNDVICAVLKAESETWAAAAALLRKEELTQK